MVEIARTSDTWSILEPVRYLPRLLGLVPYRFTNNDVQLSKIGRIYALFYATLYTVLCSIVLHYDTLVSVPVPILYWPQLISIISNLTSCIVCLIRNGFQQRHIVEFIRCLCSFDGTTGYQLSVAGKLDAKKLRIGVWISSCVPFIYYVVVMLNLILFEEKTWLSLAITTLYSSTFLAELMMFLNNASLLGVRLRYFNGQIEGQYGVQNYQKSPFISSRNIRILYCTMLNAANVLNDHYDLQFLLWSFHLSIYTICHLFILLCLPNTFAYSLYGGLILLIYFIPAITFMTASQFVGDQIDKIAIILLRKNIEESVDVKQGRQENFELSLYMTMKPYRFKAMGFFDVDMGLCNTIFVTVIMVIPVLSTVLIKFNI